MIKIPCLFQRDFSDKRNPVLLREVTPGCEWVLAGEGIATRKRDGTACMVRDGKLYKRYDAKRGKTPPEGAIPCTSAPDPVTGHWPHWILVGEEPESKWHREAWNAEGTMPNGTYELCGPHFQGNPERLDRDGFFVHGSEAYSFTDYALTWEGLQLFLEKTPIEGIVFHHRSGNGKMVKIRRDDYGFAWPCLPGGTP